MNDTSQGVTVEIYDQPYHLRGQDPVYIERLANLVDTKMRAVAAQGTTVDSLRVAVLAAINIADEYMTLQSRHRALTGSMTQAESTLRTRASNLNGLLDSVLSERRTG
jgi:cell division protein ZapA